MNRCKYSKIIAYINSRLAKGGCFLFPKISIIVCFQRSSTPLVEVKRNFKTIISYFVEDKTTFDPSNILTCLVCSPHPSLLANHLPR